MRPFRLRVTLKKLMIFVAVVAVAIFGLRAWRRQVYCVGWAGVWAINEDAMWKEAAAAATDHRDRVPFYVAQAEKYSRLKYKYKRAAYRFWEPVPTDSPRPPELR